MRILITGSRDWTNWSLIWDILNRQAKINCTLVHGACPKGADKMVDEWAGCQPDITVERYPAKWDEYGKRAGFVRNVQMVQLGADVCLAFIKDSSKGAMMTARLAEQAGIPTVRFYE